MAGKEGFFAGRKKPAVEGPRRSVDLSEFEKEVIDEARATGTVVSILKTNITPDPDQPRTHFDEASLDELAESLESEGLIQPIIVRDTGSGKYMICCGERRWRAAMRSSLTELQAIVRNDITGLKLLRMQVQENEQREGMNPLDLARVYQRALQELGGDREALYEWANKSKAYISNYLLLADAPQEIRALSERITDATSLQLITRLLKNSPEDGRALIEGIESGEIATGGGVIRKAVREKTQKKKQEAGTEGAGALGSGRQLKAVKAEWQHTDLCRLLAIETETGERLVIELPADFE